MRSIVATTHQHGDNTYVTWHVYDDDEPNTLTITRDGFAQYRTDVHVVTFDESWIQLRAHACQWQARALMNAASNQHNLGYHVTPTWGVVFDDGREPMSIGRDGWVAFQRQPTEKGA